jgi:hypothetical protein
MKCLDMVAMADLVVAVVVALDTAAVAVLAAVLR